MSPHDGSDSELSLDARKIRAIKALLPVEAHRPAPMKLLWLFAHAGVVGAAFWLAGRAGLSWWIPPLAMLAGHSIGCIAFLSHDLAHGSVLRNRGASAVFERIFWALVLISSTVWRRVHNQSHHAHFNTVDDPDRKFLETERRAATVWYARIFYPSAETFPWNPLVLLQFVPYVVGNTLTSLLPGEQKVPFIAAKAPLQPGDRAAIGLDLLIIVAQQTGLWLLTGGHATVYVLMALCAYLVTSAMSMAYIFTNHFPNSLHHEPDPLRGSTSVIVPALVDRLHCHFSYHTEHHIFPGMNSDYYPELSRHLARAFPETYSRVPFLAAWRQLWRKALFVTPPERPTAPQPERGA